jgi:scyllo-inositol 2-dehydrogenase (NADP+)
MAKQINVAIIGQGRSGRDIHTDALLRLPELYNIVAVSDQLEERRIKAERELNCAAVADYKELFGRSDVDLIVNSTPSNLHVPVSLECLERGFHVLCEKPLAGRAADVDRLMEASNTSGKLLAVFQQSRYSPAFVKIREIIASGQIGRVVQASLTSSGFSRRWDWQTLQEKNGGNLLNTGPHPLDQALQLFGADRMPTVACRMDRANSFGDAEDYVKIVLHGEGKPVIDLEAVPSTVSTGNTSLSKRLLSSNWSSNLCLGRMEVRPIAGKTSFGTRTAGKQRAKRHNSCSLIWQRGITACCTAR